jgi:hypothetical protein
MQNFNFQLQEKKIWRKLKSHERKILFSNTVMADKSRPKKMCAARGTLRNAFPFLAATH